MAKKSTKKIDKKIEDAVEAPQEDIVSTQDDIENPDSADITETTDEPVDDLVIEDAQGDVQDDVPTVADDLENTSSLSSKILTGLVLMSIGGGVALWGGPKIAPNLPAGLKPVADFLAPGQASATQQVADLKADLETKLADMATAEVDTQTITAAIADYDAQTAAKFKSLSDQLSATDGTDIEARLATVETGLAGVTGQLTELSTQLSSVDLSGGSDDAASAAKIAAYAATIEGLKSQMAQMASQQGSLSQKIDDVSASTDRKVKEAEVKVATVETQKELNDITRALETGTGFAPALTALASGGATIPDILQQSAQDGVPTLAALKTSFGVAAHAALKADAKAQPADGVGGMVTNFFKSQVTMRSLEPQEGDSANAVLSRVQGALDTGDLPGAIAQAQGLTGAAAPVLADWLSKAQLRADVMTAIGDLSASLAQ